MTMTVSTVRDNLKTQLSSISGLRIYDTVPDSINTPAAVVGMLDMDFDATMNRGYDRATLDVILITGRMSERSAQNTLDTYLSGSGNSSIKTVVEANKTLSGAVQTLRVTAATSGSIQVSGIDYLAYRFRVELIG
jgi:ABC-type xylose transport system substrate-binding protein